MAGEIKPVPTGADQTATFKFFQETVQAELDKAATASGKAPVKFDLTKAMVWNRVNGDGSFDLVYNDESLDFFCGAQVNWKSQEILLRAGKMSQGKEEIASGKLPGKPVAGKWIDDACAATEKLAGKEEMVQVDGNGKEIPATCQDGIGDARLVGADKYETVKEFEKQCKTLFDNYGQRKFGLKLGDRFDLKRTRIENPFLGEGNYSLLFENRANNFFCEGLIDTGVHTMMMRSGSTRDYEKEEGEIGNSLPINDACTMTKGLIGKEELVDPDKCKDVTKTERNRSDLVSLGWNGFLTISALWGGYRTYRKLSAMPRVVGLTRLPLIRNLGWGALAYVGYDTLMSNFVTADDPLRKYGKWVAGGTGLAAPEILRATGAASRLAAIPGAARLAPIASRASIGLALVWGMNKCFEWGIGSDYEASVNRRVTDQIYDKHVYELDGWDFLVLPLAVKGVRAGSRFLAPDAMNWAVTVDNADLKAAVYAEDKKNSEAGEEFMKQLIPKMLFTEKPEDADAIVEMLRKETSLSITDIPKAAIFRSQGPDGVKKLYPDMSDDDIETLARRVLVHEIQETAKGLVFIEQPVNDWAREIFNSDGTLKEGEDALKKLKDRWPPVFIKKAELNSHDLELSDSMSHYG